MPEPPHRVVDQILDGLLNAIKGAGTAITNSLDGLPLGTKGPQTAVNDVVDGVLTAPEVVGEGISKALDEPLKALT